MKTIVLLLGATAIALSPASASAQTTPPGNGQTMGQGYNHTNGPTTTGQPSQDCEQLIADGLGSDPGQSADNGSSAFGGSAGDVYAGSRTTKSAHR